MHLSFLLWLSVKKTGIDEQHFQHNGSVVWNEGNYLLLATKGATCGLIFINNLFTYHKILNNVLKICVLYTDKVYQARHGLVYFIPYSGKYGGLETSMISSYSIAICDWQWAIWGWDIILINDTLNKSLPLDKLGLQSILFMSQVQAV